MEIEHEIFKKEKKKDTWTVRDRPEFSLITSQPLLFLFYYSKSKQYKNTKAGADYVQHPVLLHWFFFLKKQTNKNFGSLW